MELQFDQIGSEILHSKLIEPLLLFGSDKWEN